RTRSRLAGCVPKNYARSIRTATATRAAPSTEDAEKQSPPEFRRRLDLPDSATVVYPLSETVSALLASYLHPEGPDNREQAIVSSLKQLLWHSPKHWDIPIRGVVVVRNESVVAKVITGDSSDTTECTTTQNLAERAPDIPAPRTHGLIRFGPFRVIFMSYIPDMTLAQVWPSLSHKEKVSIQQQLNDIFCRIRTLHKDDGNELRGVNGEGVKEYSVDNVLAGKVSPQSEGLVTYNSQHATMAARYISNSSVLSLQIRVLPCTDLCLLMVM
ncbi:hypothetical protein ACO22_07924, partial [Paracoccidioides brasiliensis]